jgi:hypothetical protein
MSMLLLCFYFAGTVLLQMSLRRCLKGDGSGVFVCDAGGELLIPFPWALVFAFTYPCISLGRTTSTSLALPRSAYLTTDHDTLGFADFDSKGAMGSTSCCSKSRKNMLNTI